MCFHAKNNEGVVYVYLEHGNSEHEGDEVPQLVPMTPNTITFPEANSAPLGQLNSVPPSQPHSKPQTKPTSNYPAQPTFEPAAQPKSKPAVQPNCSLAAQPHPHFQPSPPPHLYPSLNQCLFLIHVLLNQKIINLRSLFHPPLQRILKQSTPKKGAVKKVPIPPPKRVTRSASRFAPRGKKVVGEVPSVTLSSDSSDSYESAEDELYRPGPEAFESSSNDESDSEVATARPRELKMKKNKAKGKICLENLCEENELIVQNSNEEVDLGQVIGKAPEVQPPYDAFDAYHDDSDGNDSWKSEEIKTPPNSDEESDADEDDAFPMFMEGARFDELKLEIGMKFNSKHDFIEAVREFTIQEGRKINFRRNESYRVRAVCKYKKEGCKRVAYASMDHEETCWQMKTLNNNHICARRTKNRAANRKWLASKLVKKIKKYPNLKHGEASDYFKRKCDLDLNKSSLTRALSMLCVHACAAIARLNGNLEDYCHKWLTMDSYKETYKHSLNPIPGQAIIVGPRLPRFGESQKRRKDADEESSGSKKSKTDATKLPRKYKEFSCAYCGTKGHTKRSCSYKKVDDVAAALAAAAAVVIAKEKEKGANAATNVATSAAPTNSPSEIVLSQTPFSQPDNGDQEQVEIQYVTSATRPNKLQPKRKASPAPGSSSVDPLQGANAGTSLRMAEFMKFVPTPGVKPAFKPPRKK
ncbi:hypothetical protein Ahy_B02g060907 isoform A [Arachis hypogaea]|uniref:Transposase MuDR plant domain-containing protein n=1 Tax=Arachis hypogaea TaxID=3818 RepID=A0A445AJK3_ARAHY|nr:hypothetical protein Ahy_B02g060907 isoform A [Arachis hypogaea]